MHLRFVEAHPLVFETHGFGRDAVAPDNAVLRRNSDHPADTLNLLEAFGGNALRVPE
jgi:hypothetical protein